MRKTCPLTINPKVALAMTVFLLITIACVLQAVTAKPAQTSAGTIELKPCKVKGSKSNFPYILFSFLIVIGGFNSEVQLNNSLLPERRRREIR